MKKHFKRITWQIVGSVFLITGLIGLFLPLLQGLLFLLVGLFILSMTSERFREFWHSLRDSFPRFREKIVRLEQKIESKIGHWFKE